jgi:hypothetical protein
MTASQTSRPLQRTPHKTTTDCPWSYFDEYPVELGFGCWLGQTLCLAAAGDGLVLDRWGQIGARFLLRYP